MVKGGLQVGGVLVFMRDRAWRRWQARKHAGRRGGRPVSRWACFSRKRRVPRKERRRVDAAHFRPKVGDLRSSSELEEWDE